MDATEDQGKDAVDEVRVLDVVVLIGGWEDGRIPRRKNLEEGSLAKEARARYKMLEPGLVRKGPQIYVSLKRSNVDRGLHVPRFIPPEGPNEYLYDGKRQCRHLELY
jgi:hypothetical protein